MSEQSVIGYGTSFTTFFLGHTTELQVVSPINIAAPKIRVEIHYSQGDMKKDIAIEGDFFEELLRMLANIKQHTDLLAGAEFGFLASLTRDHQAILFAEVGPAIIKVFRKKGVLSGAKDIARISFGIVTIERELNEEFFREIEKLISTIEQVKQKIADKINAYLKTKGTV